MRAERRLALALAAVGLLTAAAEAGPDPGLQRCAAIDDVTARLACYDALAGRPGTASFGLSRSAPAPEEAAGITAHIVGPFTEWRKGTLVRLDNGQVWRVTDEKHVFDAPVPDNAEVTITRRFFAYWMEIRAVQRKVKVRRES